jgi:hypothetical protein
LVGVEVILQDVRENLREKMTFDQKEVSKVSSGEGDWQAGVNPWVMGPGCLAYLRNSYEALKVGTEKAEIRAGILAREDHSGPLGNCRAFPFFTT